MGACVETEAGRPGEVVELDGHRVRVWQLVAPNGVWRAHQETEGSGLWADGVSREEALAVLRVRLEDPRRMSVGTTTVQGRLVVTWHCPWDDTFGGRTADWGVKCDAFDSRDGVLAAIELSLAVNDAHREKAFPLPPLMTAPKCGECGGSGRVRDASHGSSADCDACDGAGRVTTSLCYQAGPGPLTKVRGSLFDIRGRGLVFAADKVDQAALTLQKLVEKQGRPVRVYLLGVDERFTKEGPDRISPGDPFEVTWVDLAWALTSPPKVTGLGFCLRRAPKEETAPAPPSPPYTVPFTQEQIVKAGGDLRVAIAQEVATLLLREGGEVREAMLAAMRPAWSLVAQAAANEAGGAAAGADVFPDWGVLNPGGFTEIWQSGGTWGAFCYSAGVAVFGAPSREEAFSLLRRTVAGERITIPVSEDHDDHVRILRGAVTPPERPAAHPEADGQVEQVTFNPWPPPGHVEKLISLASGESLQIVPESVAPSLAPAENPLLAEMRRYGEQLDRAAKSLAEAMTAELRRLNDRWEAAFPNKPQSDPDISALAAAQRVERAHEGLLPASTPPEHVESLVRQGLAERTPAGVKLTQAGREMAVDVLAAVPDLGEDWDTVASGEERSPIETLRRLTAHYKDSTTYSALLESLLAGWHRLTAVQQASIRDILGVGNDRQDATLREARQAAATILNLLSDQTPALAGLTSSPTVAMLRAAVEGVRSMLAAARAQREDLARLDVTARAVAMKVIQHCGGRTTFGHDETATSLLEEAHTAVVTALAQREHRFSQAHLDHARQREADAALTTAARTLVQVALGVTPADANLASHIEVVAAQWKAIKDALSAAPAQHADAADTYDHAVAALVRRICMFHPTISDVLPHVIATAPRGSHVAESRDALVRVAVSALRASVPTARPDFEDLELQTKPWVEHGLLPTGRSAFPAVTRAREAVQVTPNNSEYGGAMLVRTVAAGWVGWDWFTNVGVDEQGTEQGLVLWAAAQEGIAFQDMLPTARAVLTTAERVAAYHVARAAGIRVELDLSGLVDPPPTPDAAEREASAEPTIAPREVRYWAVMDNDAAIREGRARDEEG